MTAPELLPCPFCGDNRASTYYVRDGRVAMCPACGAKSGSQFNGPLDLPSADGRAIAAWNRRTHSPEVAALLAKMAAATESNDALTRKLMGQTETLNGHVIHYVFGKPLDEVADILDRAEALIAEARREGRDKFGVIVDAYEELLATVCGECPSLVNEDSGASQVLINLILAADAAIRALKETTHG